MATFIEKRRKAFELTSLVLAEQGIKEEERNIHFFKLAESFVCEVLFIGANDQVKKLQSAVLNDQDFWHWFLFEIKMAEIMMIEDGLVLTKQSVAINKKLTLDFYKSSLDKYIRQDFMTNKFDAKFLGKYAKVVQS